MNDDFTGPHNLNDETTETESGGAMPSSSQEPTPAASMSDEPSDRPFPEETVSTSTTQPAAKETPSLGPMHDSISSQPATATPNAPSEPTLASPSPGGPEPSHENRRAPMSILIACIVGVLLLVGVVLASYHAGHSRGYTSGKNAEVTLEAAAQLKVPADATMTAQCVTGEGTQYVKPSDIPMGPIYNVWKGKVTGIEYMLDQDAIVGSKTINLLLQNQKYNHLDVMYEPAGHAGFTTPHYHVVVSMIPYSQEQMITCSGTSSSNSTMMQ